MKNIRAFIVLVLVVTVTGCKRSKDTVSVQETVVPKESFSVVTLNVDGLPKTISIFGSLEFDVNKDGPGEEYTPVIGTYLAIKSYDFIAVQENFNYDNLLSAKLTAAYNRDLWCGDININKLTGMRFPTDGLNGFWKKDITACRTDSVAWDANYGKFNHGWDDIINKGFRRYDVRLKGGSQIVIYNMHMDAGDEEDEMRGNDIPDRLARMVQWRQLRDYILDHLDARPVIVMGDMNSWYERDSIKPQFIDYIAGTGRAIVSDIWIELEREGSYPQLTDEIVTNDPGAGDWTRNGETLDKILYLNPIGGSQLRPVSVNIDSVMYVKDDGTPLGDHNPLSATFEIINQSW